MSIRRDTVYNLAGQLVPMAVTLASLPAFLQLIGEARYGVLALVWLLVGYLGLFELGLGQAAAQRLARTEDGDLQAPARVFWTALQVNLALGAAGAVVAAGVGFWLFGAQVAMEPGLRAEMLASLGWLAAAVPLVTCTGVLTGALQGKGRFLALNCVMAFANTGVQLVPLVVAWAVGPGLPGLVLAVVAVRLASALLLLGLCRRHVAPGIGPCWDARIARGLLRFGGWVTVTAVIGPLMMVCDRFLIGAWLGAQSVSRYVIPLQLAEKLTLLSSALNMALFPRVAALPPGAARDALGLDAVQGLTMVLTPLTALGLLLFDPFLSWWLSPDIAATSAYVGQVLLLGAWVNSLALVPFTQLQARGRPDLVAKCHLAELLPYLGLLVVALDRWGLAGAAWVYTARVTIDCVLLSWLAGQLGAMWRGAVLPGTLLMALLWAGTPQGPVHAAQWVLAAAVLGWTLLTWSRAGRGSTTGPAT